MHACRQLEDEEVEAPMLPLMRALSAALALPAPLAQWPVHLLHASLTTSFPLRYSAKVFRPPPLSLHAPHAINRLATCPRT